MASRYWVLGTGTLNATNTANWSAASGGAGGASVPTSADDVFFDANSGGGVVTMSVAQSFHSIDFTGYTGTFTQAGVALTVQGPLFRLVPGMTYNGSTLTLSPSFGTTMLVTTAGKVLSSVGFGGAGLVRLQDAMTCGNLSQSVGTFDSNDFSVTATSFTSSNTSTRTLTLRSSTITLSLASALAWNTQVITGLTITANTATVVCSGTNGGFTGPTSAVNWNGLSLSLPGAGTGTIANGDQTFATVTRTGTTAKNDTLALTGNITCTVAFVVNGNSAVNRVGVGSGTQGVQRTITAASVTASNVDFGDILAAGAANWNLSAITGGSGDTQGNSGITFTTAISQNSNILAAGVSWSNAALWPTRVPLPQDDVTFRGFTAGGQTITFDMPRMGHNVTLATGTGGYTCNPSNNPQVFGNFTVGANVFWSGGTSVGMLMRGRGSHTIGGSVSMAGNFDINAVVGTYTLLSNLTTGSAFTVTSGGFVASTFNVTCATFASSNTNTRSIDMGTGTWSLTSTASGTVWNLGTSTGLTLSAASATIAITTASTLARTFQSSGGQTYGTLTYTVNNSTGSLTVNGSSIFDTINFTDATAARTLFFATNNTMTFRVWNVHGAAGRVVTVKTPTNGVAANIRQAVTSSGPFVSDYLTVQDTNAQAADGSVGTGLWYAGSHSTDVSGNTGWTFTDVPTSSGQWGRVPI